MGGDGSGKWTEVGIPHLSEQLVGILGFFIGISR